MKKVTSKDCVSFITDKIIPDLANPKNWIRIEKKNVDESIIRTFKHKPTDIVIEVMEKKGKINKKLAIVNNQWFDIKNSEDDWKGDKILFVLYQEKDSNLLEMQVVKKKFFEKNNHVDDRIQLNYISDLLRENGFENWESCEATIQFFTAKNRQKAPRFSQW